MVAAASTGRARAVATAGHLVVLLADGARDAAKGLTAAPTVVLVAARNCRRCVDLVAAHDLTAHVQRVDAEGD